MTSRNSVISKSTVKKNRKPKKIVPVPHRLFSNVAKSTDVKKSERKVKVKKKDAKDPKSSKIKSKEQFVCPECDKELKTAKTLASHIEKVHG